MKKKDRVKSIFEIIEYNKVDILIGENTANISFFDLRYIDDIQVKGKAFPIKVYGI